MDIKLFTIRRGRRVGHRERNAKQSVGAEPRFVRSSIEFHKPLVQPFLVVEVMP